MRSLFPILLVAASGLFGCSGNDTTTLYELPQAKHPTGDPTGGVNGTESNPSIDASVCVVPGQASVTGTMGGATFAPKDAVEIFDPDTARFTIKITDYAGACSYGQGTHAGSDVVSIVYDQSELTAGALDLSTAKGLTIEHVVYDSACKPLTMVPASNGTVTFKQVNECGAQGTFDLMFGADHVTASFTASVCSTAAAPSCH